MTQESFRERQKNLDVCVLYFLSAPSSRTQRVKNGLDTRLSFYQAFHVGQVK